MTSYWKTLKMQSAALFAGAAIMATVPVIAKSDADSRRRFGHDLQFYVQKSRC